MENTKLEKLSQRMKEHGFTTRMAFVNRLRILDYKLETFSVGSDQIKESVNLICNQTYNEMYENPAEQKEDSLKEAKVRAKRFEEIYDGLTEFTKLSQEDRAKFIKAKKPRYIQKSLFTRKMLDGCNGHA